MPRHDLSYQSYFFFAAAGMLVLSLIMAAVGASGILAIPGAFLFARFHLAGLYFPLLSVLGGLLIRRGRNPRRTMMMIWVSPPVFLTAAMFLQIAAGNGSVLASQVLIGTLGRVPAAILFLLLLALEGAGMVKLFTLYTRPEDVLFTWDEVRGFMNDVLGSFGLREQDMSGEAAGGEEPTLEDRPSMAFPSFPDAPEPAAQADFHPEPERPAAPSSPTVDPEVSELIRRTLTGGGTAGHSEHSTESSAARSFSSPEDDSYRDSGIVSELVQETAHQEPPALSPSFDTYESEEFLLVFPKEDGDRHRTGLPEDSRGSNRPDDIPDEDLAEDALYQDIPEEDRTHSDISEKLNPAGTEPQGVMTEPEPPGRRRTKYEVPVKGVLADYPDADFASIDDSTRRAGQVLEQTLKEFKIEAKVTGIRKGPVITMYELLPSPGVKISRIVNLQDNIALRLAASCVRIVAPIPGKHAVGIEVPNRKRAIVSFSSLVESDEFQETEAAIPVILGKDISGGNQIIDLARTPHLLIAGATGAGKSVCVNSLIGSILYVRTPQQVKLIMVDPKIVELKLYNDIPHLLAPVITEPKRALQALQWCLAEMERRYSLLDTQGVRDIKTFNKRIKDRKLATETLPYIVVIVDEFADLMATSGKELEGIVARLAAMSRAVGIHLVLATQRPSVDVITGLIKANFPSRIAFMVAGKTDSRIIIDAMGAEKLLGRGDMLFTSAWDPFPSRMQGAFLAEEEVERLAEHVKTLGEPEYIDSEMFFDDEEDEEFQLEAAGGDDPMFDKALEIVVSTRKASASYLQRRLKIGYNRAARLVEEMERRGIVGPANGSKPRDLLHIPERFAIGSASVIGVSDYLPD